MAACLTKPPRRGSGVSLSAGAMSPRPRHLPWVRSQPRVLPTLEEKELRKRVGEERAVGSHVKVCGRT